MRFLFAPNNTTCTNLSYNTCTWIFSWKGAPRRSRRRCVPAPGNLPRPCSRYRGAADPPPPHGHVLITGISRASRRGAARCLSTPRVVSEPLVGPHFEALSVKGAQPSALIMTAGSTGLGRQVRPPPPPHVLFSLTPPTLYALSSPCRSDPHNTRVSLALSELSSPHPSLLLASPSHSPTALVISFKMSYLYPLPHIATKKRPFP